MKLIVFITILVFVFCFTVFAQEGENPCPKIRLLSPEGLLKSSEPTKFNVDINGIEKDKIKYLWMVSSGKIIQGQGESEIEFLANDENAGSKVTVIVNIFGLPKNCPNSVSDWFVIEPDISDIFPDAEYEKISFKDEKTALDKILVRLSTVSDYEGFIILEFDKKDNRSYKVSRLNNILNHIKFRGFDINRFTFVIFEGDIEKTELWVIPNNIELLEIKPKDYQIAKAEELKQIINKLFLKN